MVIMYLTHFHAETDLWVCRPCSHFKLRWSHRKPHASQKAHILTTLKHEY